MINQEKHPSILLVGNTCNNNFAFLRYLLDLGYNADLVLYQDEGLSNSNPIHNPAWDISNHQSFYSEHTLRLPFRHSPSSIGLILFFFIFANKKYRELSGFLRSYNIIIASGLSPILLYLLGARITAFYPVSIGVEWLMEPEHAKKCSKLEAKSFLYRMITLLQRWSIRKSDLIIDIYGGPNTHILTDIGPKKVINLLPPHFYPLDNTQEEVQNVLSYDLIDLLRPDISFFRIFSFMRHQWVYKSHLYLSSQWQQINKHNELLIYGFKRFLDYTSDESPTLYLSSWGPDVESTEKLIQALELSSNVVWLPLLPRYALSYILKNYADVGVGEFINSDGLLWGSTGLECISCGIPLLQTVNHTNKQFRERYAVDLPSILDVRTSGDVMTHLLNVYESNQATIISAMHNKTWFETNCTHQLAEKWIAAIVNYQQEIRG